MGPGLRLFEGVRLFGVGPELLRASDVHCRVGFKTLWLPWAHTILVFGVTLLWAQAAMAIKLGSPSEGMWY